jgi:transposase InsO family protein
MSSVKNPSRNNWRRRHEKVYSNITGGLSGSEIHQVPPTEYQRYNPLLKRERVKRVNYGTRDEAKADVFDYIEVFYNRKRRRGYLGNISPAAFERWTTGLYETVH